MIVLLSISSYYLIKKNIINKFLKILLIIFMGIIPIILMFINTNNLIAIYYILYIILFIYLILKNKSIFSKEMFFFIIGISSNIVMLVSPVWDYRTSLATYIFLCIYIVGFYFSPGINILTANLSRLTSLQLQN